MNKGNNNPRGRRAADPKHRRSKLGVPLGLVIMAGTAAPLWLGVI